MQKIRDFFKKMALWIWDNKYATVIILCCLISIPLFFVFQNTKVGNIKEVLKTSVTILVSLMSFSVTSYVFLNNTLQNRRTKNSIEKDTIDSFQTQKRETLKKYIIFVVCCIVTEGFLLNFDSVRYTTDKIKLYGIGGVFVGCVACTLINICFLGKFTYDIINYDEGLKNLALKIRGDYKENSDNVKISKGEFLDLVNNIEIVVERLVNNHVHAKASNLYDSELKRAICDGEVDPGYIQRGEDMANEYGKIIKYRNLLLQDTQMLDSEYVALGDCAKKVLYNLFELHLKSELLTNVNLSNVNIGNANLKFTSFAGSSIQKVLFEEQSCLYGTDFRNCTLNGVIFKNSDCEYINFTDSKLIKVEFDQKTKLKGSCFNGADLSNLEYLGGKDKQGNLLLMEQSKFKNAMMTHLDIYNVNFAYSDFEFAQLVDCKIGESAQKDSNVNFEYANMVHANFLRSILTRCIFQNAVMNRTILTYAILKKMIFQNVVLHMQVS